MAVDTIFRMSSSVMPVAPDRKDDAPRFRTSDGQSIEACYGPLAGASGESEADRHARQLGQPGAYPFTRGVHTTMYRGRYWTMRQYAGFGSARESNERYHYLLSRGQTGLSVAFDLPTQMGYDADDDWALGEVGKSGVSICSIQDMELLLDGLPLDKVSISMTINAPAAILLAMVVAVARQRGMPTETLSGTVQNDILKEYVARGTYIFPPRPSMRLATDIIRFCQAHMPRWNPISVSGYHIREAGSTAAQEVAFTFAHAKAYVDATIQAGLPVDAFAGQLSFFFNAHNNLLEEVAKFRAARRLWARIMREEYGAQNPRSWRLRFHVQTGGSTLAAQQPSNNVVRVAVQALSAILGGAQSLHTNALDEALALPTAASAELALRTQQVLAHESGVADTVDPLGGSYYVEHLTDEIERLATEYLVQVRDLGGALDAVERGFMQHTIQEAAFRVQQEQEAGERIIVGVNAFHDTEEGKEEMPLLEVDQKVQEEQIRRVQQLRQSRDAARALQCLERIEEAARDESAHLMPLIVEAVTNLATTGEICNRLRRVWGEHHADTFI